jgi:hypothetical protein
MIIITNSCHTQPLGLLTMNDEHQKMTSSNDAIEMDGLHKTFQP